MNRVKCPICDKPVNRDDWMLAYMPTVVHRSCYLKKGERGKEGERR